jgi:hypothetical protein
LGGSTGRTEQLESSGEIGSLARPMLRIPGTRCIWKIELIQATKRINGRNPGFSGGILYLSHVSRGRDGSKQAASRVRNRMIVVSSDFHFDSDVLSF